jgi:hypothetical protein
MRLEVARRVVQKPEEFMRGNMKLEIVEVNFVQHKEQIAHLRRAA